MWVKIPQLWLHLQPMTGPRQSPSRKVQSRRFQPPRGTRDFYPADMAVRRYIESVWREVSINHGFEEVDGPTFEHLDLYTHKSGPGIVSELFQVFSGKDEEQIAAIRRGEDAPYALRPEFTPTLARMVAAKAAELPRPIKWFAIPSHFRAERPQRGRLREFMQWNVDFIGSDDSAKADAEVMACAIRAMEKLGLSPSDAWVRISDRRVIQEAFHASRQSCTIDEAFDLLDRRTRLSEHEFLSHANHVGFDVHAFDLQLANFSNATILADRRRIRRPTEVTEQFFSLLDQLESCGVRASCVPDPNIVRGLAYYTGTVFEIIAEGERAIAGGGRYDNLIESFGGPSMPACGFGMGDVVLANILHDKGLLPEEVVMQPLRPHVFVISAGKEEADAELPRLVARLRKAGYHVRHTYRSTRNVGKLLGEAAKCRARLAVILGDELAEGRVVLKDLDAGEQREFPLADLEKELRAALDR
jgi:histidyl-tRNA synthetase